MKGELRRESALRFEGDFGGFADHGMFGEIVVPVGVVRTVMAAAAFEAR